MARTDQLPNGPGRQGKQMSKEERSPACGDKIKTAQTKRSERLYEAAWDECIRRELAAAEAARGSQFYDFSVQYATSFGQELYMIGSCEELGSWDLARKVHMGWTEENYWRVKLEIPMQRGVVEYKYIVAKEDSVEWENGHNHRMECCAGGRRLDDSWGGG
mmetsp:Transcript_9914/g.18429  ORF Transcript_9914/g.18429 Transcript_9914/m.18429 type:complete len:161 (+) Transcript_9914:50-532(+)